MGIERFRAFSDRRTRQTIMISGGAIGLFLLLRALPSSEDHLNYTDFHSGETGILEFCEPGSASFVPVETVRSPVTLTLSADAPLFKNQPANFRAQLTAASGKPLTEENLLVVHTKKLHLLLTDPSLVDYQHVHPEATGVAGEFQFSVTAHAAGIYRVYADFTPRATGRALYAGSTFEVSGRSDLPEPDESWSSVTDGIVFALAASEKPIRTNKTTMLTLTMRWVDGGTPKLELIMDAYAHMVAFDFAQQGFAHLHPQELNPFVSEASSLQLSFLLNLPDPGWYRIWAQVLVAGKERFAPFTIEVIP
jgi:hypothetical protein